MGGKNIFEEKSFQVARHLFVFFDCVCFSNKL